VTGTIVAMPKRRLDVVVAPASAAPFAPQAVVDEEDTYLVLGAAREVREPCGDRLRLFHEAYTTEAVAPGTVIVRPGAPVRLLAVVHDLSRDPSWREDWIGAALAGVFREATARRFRTLAVPLLGRVHGRAPLETAVALLRATLEAGAPPHLERLWLITAEADLDELRALLASNLFR
jgi:hypothetical protein